MSDEIPDTPGWEQTPWSATHKRTLQEMLVDTGEHFIGGDECAAIEAALAEIARLEFALDTVATIAQAVKHKEQH